MGTSTAGPQFYRPHFCVLAMLVVAVLLVVHSAEAFQQARRPLRQYVHDFWTVKEGLPQNAAYVIMQSRDGYIWFGTQEGLVRFDGLEFKVFDRANNLDMQNGWVFPLGEDTKGGIWMTYASNSQGVAYFADGAVHTVDTTDGLPSNNVRYVHPTSDGSVWIFDRPSFRVTQFLNGTMKTFGQSDGLPSDSVFTVSTDSKGNLWFNTPRGIAKYDGQAFHVYTTKEGLPANNNVFGTGRLRVETIFEDSKGNIWMGTGSGLVRMTDGTIKVFSTKDGLLDNAANPAFEATDGALWLASQRGFTKMVDGQVASTYPFKTPLQNVNDISIGKDNTIWIATNNGLWRFADGVGDHYGKENGLTNEQIDFVFVDSEGSVWFGQSGVGLHRLRVGKFVTFSEDDGLQNDDLTTVFEDSKQNLWMGTQSGGLARLSPGGALKIFDEKDNMFPRVIGIAEDRQGTIWVTAGKPGVTAQLFRITDERVQHYTQSGMNLSNTWRVMARKSGSLLVSTRDSIFNYQNGKLSLINNELAGKPSAISLLMEDSQQQVWVGTYNAGLYLLKDDNKLYPFTKEQGFPATRVHCVYEDSDGAVWIGTGIWSVYRYKDGKFFQFTPKNGFPEYGGHQIMEDDLGYLWVTSNKAVYRFEKKALDDFADGKITSYTYNTYGTADGMKSGETNATGWPNIWKMKDGRIVTTTVAGAAIVNPADIKLNEIPPPVVVNQFIIEGEQQQTNTVVNVPAGKDRFEFHYAGLSFIGADKVRYKYKLEGYDENWTDAGGRRDAYYTNLGPGEYTFRVMAANSDGIWNETGASLQFIKMPYFYQTTWFLSLAVFMFLTTGPSFYYIRMKSVKKHAAELEALVQKRTHELQNTVNHLKETQNQLVLSEKMASLGQLTAGIAHEIKNPLNFITNFAVLSKDLTQDLRAELAAEKHRVDPNRAKEIEELLADLEQNVGKINDHGKRADSIVRGMLLHSRGKAGERQETDINALLAEYTNLAYHGMRALDQSFNVKIETEFDPSIGKISVVPQDLSRAFLNIVNNACYAANDKRKNAKNGFNPIVKVSAKNLGDKVEIRIRDNGNGIPHEVLNRMFNPFFTTKPAGVGTGLGLSLTYDIITQVHKGEINVDTQEGEYAEFIIKIPRDTGTNGGTQA